MIQQAELKNDYRRITTEDSYARQATAKQKTIL